MNLEVNLFKNEAFDEQILNSVPSGIFIVDDSLKVVFANVTARKILQDTENKILEVSLSKIVASEHDLLLAKSLVDYQRVRNNGEIASEVIHFETFTNRIISVDVNVIANSLGASPYVLLNFSNVSENKRLNQQIIQSEQRFNRILKATEDGLFEWRIPEEEIWYSERFKELYDHELFTHAPTSMQLWLEHVDPEYREKVQADLDRHFNEGVKFYTEWLGTAKGGQKRWFMLRADTTRDSDGQPLVMSGAVSFIDERKKAEERLIEKTKLLQESNSALEKFAYVASHDLQEPLRKITTFSNSISQRLIGKLNDPDADYELSRLGDAATRMRLMIKGLLTLSRITDNSCKLESCKLTDIVSRVEENLAELISETKAQINVLNDHYLLVDVNLFSLLMQNLIQNSIKYSKVNESPKIMIDVESSSSIHNECHVTISVKDFGIGFDNKWKEAMFEPFKRLSMAGKARGSGIGLAICKQIVKVHKGSIVADGRSGEGALFKIEIPSKTNIS